MIVTGGLHPLIAQGDRAAFNARAFNRIGAIALTICTYVLFVFFYRDALGGIYQGMPRVMEAPFDIRAFICVFACGCLVPVDIARPSSLVLIYALHAFFIPVFLILSVYEYGFQFYAITAVSFAILCSVCRLNTFEVADVAYGKKTVALLVTVVLSTIVLLWFTNRGAYQNFSLLEVSGKEIYAARDNAAEVNSILAYYLVGWASNVLNTVLLGYALLRRKIWPATIYFVIQFMMFFMMAEKRILLLPFILVAMFVASGYRRAGPYFVVATIWLVTIATWLLYALTGNLLAVAFLARREFFGASMVSVNYFDVFSNVTSPIYWSNSVLRFFSAYNYYITPQMVVGSKIAGEVGQSANAGFLASGFMNAGFIGVILYAFLIGLLMNVADSLVAKRMNLAFGAMLCYFPFMVAIAETDFFPALLSGGLIVLFPVLAGLGKRA